MLYAILWDISSLSFGMLTETIAEVLHRLACISIEHPCQDCSCILMESNGLLERGVLTIEASSDRKFSTCKAL